MWCDTEGRQKPINNEIENTEVFKLHRSSAPETSVESAKKVSSRTKRLQELVLREVTEAGEQGITAKEIRLKYPDLPYSSITARPAALLEKKFIYYQGDKRDGARVIRAVEFKLT